MGMMAPFIVLVAVSLNATSVREGDFVLSVKTLAAVRGGPHVVDVSLTYLGQDPATVRTWGCMYTPSLQLFSRSPAYAMPWCYQVDSNDAPIMGVDVAFSRGDTVSERYFLHHSSSQFSKDGVPFRAESLFRYWRTANGATKGELIDVALEKNLVFKRTKATPDRLLDIRTSLVKLMRVQNERLRVHDTNGWSEWDECWNWLQNTKQLELCPVAVTMLEDARNSEAQWFSFKYLIDCTGSIDAANRLLISELKKPDLASAGVFAAWKHPKFKIPSKDQARSLLEAPNVWVRALTVAAFPQYFEKKDCEAIRRQVMDSFQPEPSKEFLSVVADLDNSRFQVREEATKKLAQMGERVEYMIIRALDNSPSAEAKQRLERVLHEMVTADPIPESFRVIRALKRIESPEAKELLKVIADGPAGLRSTREAKKAK